MARLPETMTVKLKFKHLKRFLRDCKRATKAAREAIAAHEEYEQRVKPQIDYAHVACTGLPGSSCPECERHGTPLQIEKFHRRLDGPASLIADHLSELDATE